jgi:hypothetical protein
MSPAGMSLLVCMQPIKLLDEYSADVIYVFKDIRQIERVSKKRTTTKKKSAHW